MKGFLESVMSLARGRKVGLATWLVVSYGGLSLVLAIAMALVIDHGASRYVKTDVAKEVAALAAEMREQLDRGIFERLRDIQIVASNDSMRDPNVSVDTKRAALAKLQAANSDYAIITLVNAEGKILATSNEMLEGLDVSTREYFIDGRTAPFVGDVHDAIALAKLLPNQNGEVPRLVDVAAPITQPDGSFGGVVVAHMYWRWADRLKRSVLRSHGESLKTEVLIVSKDGIVLLGPPLLQGHRLKLESIRQADAGKTGSVMERWPDGNTYLT
ncbi:MAG: cache domain-containing protein, partial [Devosia sp.]